MSNNISKSFQKHEVLKNITLNIADGESIAIIGQSGVGKSVLLKHINGLLKPDSGKVIVDNLNINALSFVKKQTIRKKINNFTIIVHPPLKIYQNNKTDTESMLEIHKIIEKWITANPTQWFWQHNRFG